MRKRKIIFGVIVVGGLVALYARAGFMTANDAVSHSEVVSAETKAVVLASNSAPVATLGSAKMSAEELQVWLESLPANVRAALPGNRDVLEQWLRNQLSEKVLLAEAQSQNWAQRPEVAKAIELSTREIILRSYLHSVSLPPEGFPTETDLSAAFEQNKDRLLIPARYHVRQIYLNAPVGDSVSVAAAKQQADALVKQARTKGTDFSELARVHSNDASTAVLGGDIGLQPLAQLLPEVRPVVAEMKPGEIANPVQTATGLHILKLDEIQEPRNANRKEVEVQLRQALIQQRQAQIAQVYVESVLTSLPLSIDGHQLTKLLE